jgi:phosphatidylserine/phosphatidylglycerophosphate/cardiolipin synthase-like enzyme
MTTPLLDLPSYQRQKLVIALRTKVLAPPYPDVAVISTIGAGSIAAAVTAELRALEKQGISGAAIAYALTLAGEASAGVHRPDLVWSGETVPGVHARKTRQVFDELICGAVRSLWISSYTYWNGAQAFAKLAARMDATPDLVVRLLLNIQRGKGDSSTADELASAFAADLWKHWPGDRRPEVYFDPRALKDGTGKAVLHAKAVVADDEAAFITSANLTEKAFDENIEVGILTRDRTVASALARHFAVLIEHSILEPLPS